MKDRALIQEELSSRGRQKAHLHSGPSLLLLAVLVILSPLVATVSHAGALTTNIRITAAVLPWAKLSVLSQPDVVHVTDQDIKRGFVQLDTPSIIELRSNSKGCMLMVSLPSGLFKEVQMNIGGRETILNRPEALIELPFRKHLTVPVNYRFILAEGVSPGTYDWPVRISAGPL